LKPNGSIDSCTEADEYGNAPAALERLETGDYVERFALLAGESAIWPWSWRAH
jgi:hypothetical protein